MDVSTFGVSMLIAMVMIAINLFLILVDVDVDIDINVDDVCEVELVYYLLNRLQ